MNEHLTILALASGWMIFIAISYTLDKNNKK